MRYAATSLLVLVLIVGCGQQEEKKKEPIPLDQVPEKVMKVAREKLPDVKFERAMRKPNGDYEIIGKNKQGKTIEIEITPAGEVVAIE
jgi:hypothetical protein